jgi:MFS family permease
MRHHFMNVKNGPISLLLIAYFSYVVVGMPLATLNITWTYIQPTFEVTLGSLGILLGTLTAGYLFASVISGWVVGRVGMGRTLLIGSIIAALGMLSYLIAPRWPVFLACSLVFSIGLCLLDTSLNTFVSAHYSAGRLNWMHAAFGIGATFGPLADCHLRHHAPVAVVARQLCGYPGILPVHNGLFPGNAPTVGLHTRRTNRRQRDRPQPTRNVGSASGYAAAGTVVRLWWSTGQRRTVRQYTVHRFPPH